MLDFSMLRNLEVVAPEEKVTKSVKGLNKDIKGDIRITKSGHIYYGDSFKADLTCTIESVEEETGVVTQVPALKYLDVIDGTKEGLWGPGVTVPFLFIAVQPNGTEKAAIQGRDGKVAFIDKQFKHIANTCYGVNWSELPFIDFTLIREEAKEVKIAAVPRVNKKGEDDYVRRENIVMIPLVPTSMLTVEAPIVEQMEIPFEVDNEA